MAGITKFRKAAMLFREDERLIVQMIAEDIDIIHCSTVSTGDQVVQGCC
jgi:hypothetical protein